MLPIRTILCPTDFSQQSAYALRLACSLAGDHGARLILLHVAALPVAVYGEAALIPEPEDYQESLKQQLEQIHVPDPSIEAERRFEEGDAAIEILRVAQEVEAELIVMGTHGRTGLSRLLMGSVAEQVVRKSDCPVLTVKTPFKRLEPSLAESAQEAVHA